MGYPVPPPYPWPPPSPPRNAVDVTVSIIGLVLTVLLAGAGSVMGVFSLAFLDYCPPESCSVDGAVTAATGTIGAAAAVALVGLIVTIVRLGRRKTAWPFAVGSVVALIAVFGVGAMAYTAAVS